MPSMATPNPMAGDSTPPPPATVFCIAGIKVHVYGLSAVPSGPVAVLWLLHPRLQKAETMAPIAGKCLAAAAAAGKSLVCVSFDQRNHGTRIIDPKANEAWRQGGERHAVDMWGIFHGTALDTSQLMDLLPAYIEREVSQHLALGVSLGGHSAWHCLFHEPRCSAAVVVVGCPDYANLMADRARLSKLASWTQSHGKGWLGGSKDFPSSLAADVARWDPAGLLLATGAKWDNHAVPERTRVALAPLSGKKVLVLSGGQDKLVPYAQGAAVLGWLKHATGSKVVEDIVDPGAGHEFSPLMQEHAVRFVCEALGARAGPRI